MFNIDKRAGMHEITSLNDSSPIRSTFQIIEIEIVVCSYMDILTESLWAEQAVVYLRLLAWYYALCFDEYPTCLKSAE